MSLLQWQRDEIDNEAAAIAAAEDAEAAWQSALARAGTLDDDTLYDEAHGADATAAEAASNERFRRAVRRAGEIGADHGRAFASWAFDGNTPAATFAWALDGIDAGDPAVLDGFAEPTLSGEWADGYTLADLAHDTGLDIDDPGDAESLDVASATYEDTAREVFWAEVEQTARRMIASDGPEYPAEQETADEAAADLGRAGA
jgi:hypothetical protein